MTEKNRRERKLGNQVRKIILMRRQRTGDKAHRAYYCGGGLIQNGKYTALAHKLARQAMPA